MSFICYNSFFQVVSLNQDPKLSYCISVMSLLNYLSINRITPPSRLFKAIYLLKKMYHLSCNYSHLLGLVDCLLVVPFNIILHSHIFDKLLTRSAAAAKSLQSYLTLCDPIDGSPPGSPVPGILQARTLEWVAISFSNA